jgi:cell division protease FtsH
MVTKWGLSEKLGPLMYAEDENEGYLGRGGGGQNSSLSGETAKVIDSEVRSIIDQCYGTARQILTDNRDKLDAMADALMKYETIDADQIDDIMAGRTPREPRDWSGGSGPTTGIPVAPVDRPESPIGGPAAQH